MRSLLSVVALLVLSVSAHAQAVAKTASGQILRRASVAPRVSVPALVRYSKSVRQVTARGDLQAGSVLDWGALVEAPYNTVPNPFQMSKDGVQFVGSFAQKGMPAEVRHQGDDWAGNFNPGEPVLFTVNTGPVTLNFDPPISAVGAQIQSDYYGPFVAQIDLFSGSTLIGSFTANGNSTDDEDGSAVFIGAQDDTGSTITSIVLSLSSCPDECADFGVNQLSFR